ncbi:hypothetical protein N4G58_08290 [Edwardsiella piscicida]|nr:hypothetical protein N4G58_08290 [Edwardsiella piscicida]
MGSAAATLRQTAALLNRDGGSNGVLTLHLYRPFPSEAFLNALPAACQVVTVLDRTKEPGAQGSRCIRMCWRPWSMECSTACAPRCRA